MNSPNQSNTLVNRSNYEHIESGDVSWEIEVSTLERWEIQKDINYQAVEEILRVEPDKSTEEKPRGKKYFIDSHINY